MLWRLDTLLKEVLIRKNNALITVLLHEEEEEPNRK